MPEVAEVDKGRRDRFRELDKGVALQRQDVNEGVTGRLCAVSARPAVSQW